MGEVQYACERPRPGGALAHAWNHVSGALARFASAAVELKNNYGRLAIIPVSPF